MCFASRKPSLAALLRKPSSNTQHVAEPLLQSSDYQGASRMPVVALPEIPSLEKCFRLVCHVGHLFSFVFDSVKKIAGQGRRVMDNQAGEKKQLPTVERDAIRDLLERRGRRSPRQLNSFLPSCLRGLQDQLLGRQT